MNVTIAINGEKYELNVTTATAHGCLKRVGPTFSIGDRFEHTLRTVWGTETYVYMLVSAGPGCVLLINVKTGERRSEPVDVVDYQKITLNELYQAVNDNRKPQSEQELSDLLTMYVPVEKQ